ncbi:hypothetical protein PhCBS80983_g04981 [Powellomyces hirtus]|uniref:Peptide hydrolase n=1 Tax=Powellomyces hirtus TaxID=109895 RepID=A0A507DWF5_9FUNG|nr:hypothetical protein PhCBS80983_g04981 [Powellomyces hirtus]
MGSRIRGFVRRPLPATNALFLLVVLLSLLVLLADFSRASARLVHRSCCSPTQLSTLASLSAKQNLTVTGSTLSPFMVPRVSGTANNTLVQQHIISTFTALDWHVDQDPFEDNTPIGRIKFNNIIVTKNINAARKLVLAAHFDSKYFKDQEFIGATDSAVPCAILVDIATTLNPYLDTYLDPSLTIQMIFFDGEEAFKTWTLTDSLYGSRHLAEKWAATYVSGYRPSSSGIGNLSGSSSHSILSTIDVLVLLDLLGSRASPGGKPAQIYNTHPETAHHWQSLVEIQQSLAKSSVVSAGLVGQMTETGDNGYLMASSGWQSNHAIDDDHRPFQQRGVPIVHIIPQQFPTVWHTVDDNADAIDPEIVHDFALIFRVFVAQYLGLNVF